MAQTLGGGHYKDELGIVKEGALAELILVDGNPLEDLDPVADPDKNFVVIMKDGMIYKKQSSRGGVGHEKCR